MKKGKFKKDWESPYDPVAAKREKNYWYGFVENAPEYPDHPNPQFAIDHRDAHEVREYCYKNKIKIINFTELSIPSNEDKNGYVKYKHKTIFRLAKPEDLFALQMVFGT